MGRGQGDRFLEVAARRARGRISGWLPVGRGGRRLSALRKDIDGAEMDEVYVEDEPEFGMPPLADDQVTGVPEVDPREPAYRGTR